MNSSTTVNTRTKSAQDGELQTNLVLGKYLSDGLGKDLKGRFRDSISLAFYLELIIINQRISYRFFEFESEILKYKECGQLLRNWKGMHRISRDKYQDKLPGEYGLDMHDEWDNGSTRRFVKRVPNWRSITSKNNWNHGARTEEESW